MYIRYGLESSGVYLVSDVGQWCISGRRWRGACQVGGVVKTEGVR